MSIYLSPLAAKALRAQPPKGDGGLSASAAGSDKSAQCQSRLPQQANRLRKYPDGRTKPDVMWSAVKPFENRFVEGGFAPPSADIRTLIATPCCSNLYLTAEFDDPVRRDAKEFRCRQCITMHDLEQLTADRTEARLPLRYDLHAAYEK